MRKKIILSVNENPIYQFTLPLVVWSWLRIGWQPFLLQHNIKDDKGFMWEVSRAISKFNKKVHGIDIGEIPGYRSDTIAQVSRLYAACFMDENDYIMLGDADMMALSDYWQYKSTDITVWGHDLTGYQQIPMCYVGMSCQRWREVMGIPHSRIEELMKRDLDEMPDAKENGNQVDRWSTDQRLLTKRINETQYQKVFINRGVLANAYPVGRIDRSAWATFHPNPIDCHLPHDIHTSDETFAKVMRMLASVFPREEFYWFAEYREQFKRLING